MNIVFVDDEWRIPSDKCAHIMPNSSREVLAEVSSGVLLRYLTRLSECGHTVTLIASAEAAIRHCTSIGFSADILVLDIQMPRDKLPKIVGISDACRYVLRKVLEYQASGKSSARDAASGLLPVAILTHLDPVQMSHIFASLKDEYRKHYPGNLWIRAKDHPVSWVSDLEHFVKTGEGKAGL